MPRSQVKQPQQFMEGSRTPTTPWAELVVEGEKGRGRIRAILDTGAEVSLVSSHLVDKLGVKTEPYAGKFVVANNQVVQVSRVATFCFDTTSGLRVDLEKVAVHEGARDPFLVGIDVLCGARGIL